MGGEMADEGKQVRVERGRGRRPDYLATTSTDRRMSGDEAREANEAMAHKLKRNGLRRRASARGLELRHSAYGYSLIDGARKQVDGRNDLTLDDVESYLTREP
jgi:hypothetical protein